MGRDEKTLVSLLTGHRTSRITEMEHEGVVPPFLAEKYARESAAREAVNLSDLSPALTAALLRASFEDEEEDVRAAARHALIMHGGSLGDIVYLALTMDPDPEVRESAFDEALEIEDQRRRMSLLRQAAAALANDNVESVRLRAREFEETAKSST